MWIMTSKKTVFAIIFLGTIILTTSGLNNAAAITTETIIPTDATYNNSDGPFANTVHNDDGSLVVESAVGFNDHDTRKIWLKFDLPVSSVISATLSLYAVGGETLPTSTDVYFHNDNNWSEETLTFNNEPAHFSGLTSGPFATNIVSDVNQYYDFDVTALINTAGSTTVTMVLSNTDIEGNNAIAFTDETSTTQPILVIQYEQVQNQDPACSAASPSQASLWPPNHKMKDITIDGVTDPDSDPVTLTINGITQDEPTSGTGSGDKSPDGNGVGTNTAQIRSERAGTGDGRVYEISFTANDGNGGTCTGSVQVGVPHDQSGNPAVNSGQNFDSTQ